LCVDCCVLFLLLPHHLRTPTPLPIRLRLPLSFILTSPLTYSSPSSFLSLLFLLPHHFPTFFPLPHHFPTRITLANSSSFSSFLTACSLLFPHRLLTPFTHSITSSPSLAHCTAVRGKVLRGHQRLPLSSPLARSFYPFLVTNLPLFPSFPDPLPPMTAVRRQVLRGHQRLPGRSEDRPGRAAHHVQPGRPVLHAGPAGRGAADHPALAAQAKRPRVQYGSVQEPQAEQAAAAAQVKAKQGATIAQVKAEQRQRKRKRVQGLRREEVAFL
jgi:hypothetical protein